MCRLAQYEQCKEGKAQHKSKAKAKLPSMAGQCRQRVERRGEREERGAAAAGATAIE